MNIHDKYSDKFIARFDRMSVACTEQVMQYNLSSLHSLQSCCSALCQSLFHTLRHMLLIHMSLTNSATESASLSVKVHAVSEVHQRKH